MNKFMTKKLILIIVVLTIVGAGAFYGGMKYGQLKRQQFFQANIGGAGQQVMGINRGMGSNFLNGEVIAKDEQSLTLKTPDGSSKIVFFSGSTKVSKTIDGTIDDIEIGKQIMVTGSQNSDGSYTAQTISERQLPPQPKI